MPGILSLGSKQPCILHEKNVPANQTTLFYQIKLPVYTQGIFFSRDSRPGDYEWPNNTNRLLPWTFERLSDITGPNYVGIPSNAQPSLLDDAILLELSDSHYPFLKALSGKNSLSWFQVNKESLNLYLSTLGTDCLPQEAPLLLSGYGKTVYEALQQAYSHLINDTKVSSLKQRKDKEFFDAFNYLGWCTWEHYHYDIDESKILKDLNTIESSGLPIRYVLIDDGHLSHIGRQLKSFVPDKKLFTHPVTVYYPDKTATLSGHSINIMSGI